MNTDEKLKAWLEDSLTQAEREAYEQTEEFQQLQRLFRATRRFQAPEFSTETAFHELRAKRTAAPVVSSRQAWLFPLLRVAAVLVLVAGGIGYLFYQPSTELIAGKSERTQFFLPDSTEVVLNAVTTLRYKHRSWNQEREVALEGEAFFKVRKGSSFKVTTRIGVVNVLGTQFNVRVRGDHLEVSCYQGKVAVGVRQQNAFLTPGMILIANDSLMSTRTVGVGSLPTWLNRESSFESMPLQEVIRELERQYGIQVTTRNVDTTKLFTGRFTHHDLEIALESIAYPLHMTYTISADRKLVDLAGENP
jgi:ferric-dicitrate binding protein FerR (iron transport regulator)